MDQLLEALLLSDFEVSGPMEAEIAIGLLCGLGGPAGIDVGQELWQRLLLDRLVAMGTPQAIGLMRAMAELSEGRARDSALSAFAIASGATAPPA